MNLKKKATCKQSIRNKENIRKGDLIEFTRKGYSIEGIVVSIRDTTVMVELNDIHSKMLDISNNLTVVNHQNYKIIQKSILTSLVI